VGEATIMNDTMLEIRGIVLPADWDTNGNVVAVSIATAEERDYLVDDTDIVRELINMLRKRVKVRGHFMERDKRRTLKVTSYSLINGADEGGLDR
jgi:hypothetical protein